MMAFDGSVMPTSFARRTKNCARSLTLLQIYWLGELNEL